MRKTIDLSQEDIDKIEEYQKRNGLKNFSVAVRSIIQSMDCNKCGHDCTCDREETPKESKTIYQLCKEINEKIDIMLPGIAPKSAGEV